jgi:hypothetical protein
MRRKPGLSLEEFSAYWRDEHGPRVAAHQTRLDIWRYSQAHRDPAAAEVDERARAARDGMEPPYDGATEIWWTSEDALQAALSADGGRRALAELIGDEQEFVDLAASPLWFAHEYPQVGVQHARPLALPKSGVVRITLPLRALAELTEDDARRYWLTTHAPLVRSHAVARGVIAYQQVHRYESALADDLRQQRGTVTEPYLGHAEAWFDRLVSRAGPEVDAAAGAALADERNFIDFDRSTLWTSKELLFVDRNWR